MANNRSANNGGLTRERETIFCHELYNSPRPNANYAQLRQIEHVSAPSGSPLMPSQQLSDRTLSAGLAVPDDMQKDEVVKALAGKLNVEPSDIQIAEVITLDYHNLMTESQFQRAGSLGSTDKGVEFMSERREQYKHLGYQRDEDGNVVTDSNGNWMTEPMTYHGNQQYRRTFIVIPTEDGWKDVASEKTFPSLSVDLRDEDIENGELQKQNIAAPAQPEEETISQPAGSTTTPRTA